MKECNIQEVEGGYLVWQHGKPRIFKDKAELLVWFLYDF